MTGTQGQGGGDIYAIVGGVGGAGATRLSVEFAATLARAGRDAAVADASFTTQGLAALVPERFEPDVTRVLTDDRALAEAEIRLSLDLPGSVTVAPARAPFERLARAKTSECARRLAERLSAAADRYDAVFVDVPPVGANQAVATVTAADTVALVVPDTERGSDAIPRMCDRLADVETYPIRRDSVETAEKTAVMERVTDRVNAEYDDVTTLDGVRVGLDDAWFLLRASGTQPIVRITAEARDAERAQLLARTMLDAVEAV